jgi:SHS family lactate transporter-like MFS transporter
MYSQMPSYLSERFPTELRTTASGVCFHQVAGGSVAPGLTYFARLCDPDADRRHSG